MPTLPGRLHMLETAHAAVPPDLPVVEPDITGAALRGQVRDEREDRIIERYAQSYRDEWTHFVRVLNGEEAPCPSGEDGRRALLLAEAAYRSLETGRRVDLTAN